MIYEQEKLHEINELSWSYRLYLRLNGKSYSQAKECAVGLQSLYWQAGEQMGNLLHLINKGQNDGFLFRMMIGTAYSILECLEEIAEKAMIGEKVGSGYIIRSETHFISLMKLYGDRKRNPEFTFDYDYLRFLRSFICVHPLSTNYEKTVSGFIPGDYAYCKFVDFIVGEPSHINRPDGADYWVQVLDDGSHWADIDFYINSEQIWQFVKYRFSQLVDTIYQTMKLRIDDSFEKLYHTKIVDLPEKIDLPSLDLLIEEDWVRGENYHTELMKCKLFIKIISEQKSWNHLIRDTLKQWTWQYVHYIADHVQKLSELSDNPLQTIMSAIGCDHNQYSNFCDLLSDDYSFGRDCDDFVEEGKDNYQKKERIMVPADERIRLYEHAKQTRDNNPTKNPVDIVTGYYVTTNYSRSEIARLYFIIVLPDFVKKYRLYEKICNMGGSELYLYITACALLETKPQLYNDEQFIIINEGN